LGQLAAAVARQLNGLGSMVSRHTTLALDGRDSDEALRSSLEELSTAAAEANSLARQLHTFSGSQVAEPVWFDPNARLSQMYRYLLGLLGEGIDLELALGEDLGELLADPGQWDEVIVNLVQNAREAMPEGGRLRIETSAAEVDEN